jgi:CRP-like cAMP-binding protein
MWSMATHMPDQLTALRDVPLFAGLDDDGLRRVLDVAVERVVPAGEVLARASEAGASMFVILQGSVVVENPGRDPIELGAGEFVGELALLIPEAVRSAWVRARTDLHCLEISGDDFERLLEDEPRIALTMLPLLARRFWRYLRGA